jgi:hypothetical protein
MKSENYLRAIYKHSRHINKIIQAYMRKNRRLTRKISHEEMFHRIPLNYRK